LLSKKDQEMKAMEAKYKKYLEKAKSVSSTTRVVFSSQYMQLVCRFRDGLSELLHIEQ
jgi:hypothetical protein